MRERDIEARKILTQAEKEFYSAVRQEMDCEEDEYAEQYSVGVDQGVEIYCEKIKLNPSKLRFSYEKEGIVGYIELDFSVIEAMQDKRNGVRLFLVSLRMEWAKNYFDKYPGSAISPNYILEQYYKDRETFYSNSISEKAVVHLTIDKDD